MPPHTKQHFIPQSYLEGWCDPTTPDRAYVWRFAKDGTHSRRKARRAIFHEPDLYTIQQPDGPGTSPLGLYPS